MRRTQRPAETPTSLATRVVGAAGEHDAVLGELRPTLPADHPVWQRDVLAVSARVRTLLAALTPVAVQVLSFWDHVLRALSVGGRRLELDPSGCYRVLSA
jgi:hypothetical protein